MFRPLLMLFLILAAGCSDGTDLSMEEDVEVPETSPDVTTPEAEEADVSEGVEDIDSLEPESSDISQCEQKGCDDQNPCTYSTCIGEVCVHSPLEGVPCDDGEVCTVADVCDDAGDCVAGGQETCEDISDCTEEYCEPGIGCISANLPNGFPCDDGNSCSMWDECKLGVCASGAELTCDDANNCTVLQGCDPDTGKCLFLTAPDGAFCDDGNPCSAQDSCISGNCVPGQQDDCDDANVCTTDFCNPKNGVCSNVAGYGDCDDGASCTVDDECVEGVCMGVAESCDDGNPCTSDACDELLGCVTSDLISVCDDGDLCTGNDVCEGGACIPGAPVDCTATENCAVGFCDAATGDCLTVWGDEGQGCDDGDACTTDDACDDAGTCSGLLLECDDDNSCTVETCVAGAGCSYADLDGSPCSEPGACGKSTCDGGTCVTQPNEPCDDDNLCTSDFCSDVLGCVYLTNPAENCDDGVPCTFDTCIPEQGCIHTPSGSACDDGSPCTFFECDPVTGCTSQKQFSCCGNGIIENDEICDDGNVVAGDGCTPLCKGEIGSQFANCNELKWTYPLVGSGIYTLDVDGDEGANTPQKTYCEMGLDDGGWTLLAVVSDDGTDTWTAAEEDLWLTSESVGAVTNLFADYAHGVRQEFLVEDVLFLHQPSGQWAAYRGVSNGTLGLGGMIEDSPASWCDLSLNPSYPMTAGDLDASGELCSSELYIFAPELPDAGCDSSLSPGIWAWPVASSEDGCNGEEEPSWSGIGADSPAVDEESISMGYGAPLQLNTGEPGAGVNAMWVFVRSGVCGDGAVNGAETCDDGNQLSGDGCGSDCQTEVE